MISKWADNGVTLMGIYHTHVKNGITLSRQDKKYIESIMRSISNNHVSLYFPIIIPMDTIIAYKAKLVDSKIKITREKVLLKNEKRLHNEKN